MSKQAKSAFNQLPATQELPHLPTSVMELQELLFKDQTDAKILAKTARKDPLIAANILKIANHMNKGKDTEIDSLEHAISYIGINSLSDIILAASIQGFPFKTKVFSSEQFWQESMLTGKISAELANRYNPKIIPDEAYIAGSLCNIGKVVTAICYPERADQYTTVSKDPKNPKPWTQIEQEDQQGEHTVLGEIAATIWGLPEYTANPIAYHHKPLDLHRSIDLVDIVTFANQMTHWVMLDPHLIDHALLKACRTKFQLESEQDLDALATELMAIKELGNAA